MNRSIYWRDKGYFPYFGGIEGQDIRFISKKSNELKRAEQAIIDRFKHDVHVERDNYPFALSKIRAINKRNKPSKLRELIQRIDHFIRNVLRFFADYKNFEWSSLRPYKGVIDEGRLKRKQIEKVDREVQTEEPSVQEKVDPLTIAVKPPTDGFFHFRLELNDGQQVFIGKIDPRVLAAIIKIALALNKQLSEPVKCHHPVKLVELPESKEQPLALVERVRKSASYMVAPIDRVLERTFRFFVDQLISDDAFAVSLASERPIVRVQPKEQPLALVERVQKSASYVVAPIDRVIEQTFRFFVDQLIPDDAFAVSLPSDVRKDLSFVEKGQSAASYVTAPIDRIFRFFANQSVNDVREKATTITDRKFAFVDEDGEEEPVDLEELKTRPCIERIQQAFENSLYKLFDYFAGDFYSFEL